MKKIVTIDLVLIGLVFLTGCSLQLVGRTQPTTPVPVAQQPMQSVDKQPTQETGNSQIVSPTKETPATEHAPVIMYYQYIKTIGDSPEKWPIVKILQKIGNMEPEYLADVGGVGEYPDNFQLSPDKKFLLINLRSKLQILNLTTKELKDLFTPKRQVSSVSYSPDGKQLLIWDQKYGPIDGNNSYYVHLFTFASKKDQILTQGTNISSFFGTKWRDDNKIILEEAHGEFSTPYYFDLTNNQISKTPGNFNSGLLSPSGKVMAVVKESVHDVCNDFSESASSVYNIINPVSGKILGTIGGSGNSVSVLAFSPDDEYALYVAEKPWANRDDCNKKIEKSYYKVRIASGQSTKSLNYSDILKSWNKDYIGATQNYNPNKSTWSVNINDQAIITSDKEFFIIGEFYN